MVRKNILAKKTMCKKYNIVKVIILLFLNGVMSSCDFDDYNAVNETETHIEIHHENYSIMIEKEGFKYSFQRPNGLVIAKEHPVSGVRISEFGGSEFFDAQSTSLESYNQEQVHMIVTISNGEQADVKIDLFQNYSRFSIIPRNQHDSSYIIDARTASLNPVFGLGDYGSHSNEFNDVDGPCGTHVEARNSSNLIGFVRNEIINQGSCRRFVSNFTIFSAHNFAQVLFHDGKKRVGFTETENRIGAADVQQVNTLYYFMGNDLQQIYLDYKNTRINEGYYDVKPRFRMFETGWEAYGALGWDTYQASVMENIETYLNKGFPLRWGVVGSGFWPGDRTTRTEGTTVSFGMWDDTETPREDNLPNPRYPDPDALKSLFEENDLKLILGLRNHFKDPSTPEYNEENDGLFPVEALDNDYYLRASDGKLVRSTNNSFPGGPIFFLDSFNDEAMEWFKEGTDLWEVDGFKEDAMIYDRLYQDRMWNPFNQMLSENGYLIIVRNSAYSVPGDLIRINDTYAGTGEHFHADAHRIPLNLLSNAASGAPNGYPDIVGGTPTSDPTSSQYQKYYVRNVMLAAVSPSMSFGTGPWLLNHPEYEKLL